MQTRRENTRGVALLAFLLANALILFASFGISASPNLAFAEESASASVPMYRLYNPNSGEHFYTASAEERADVVAAGWSDEGIGWYAPASGDPVYRLYNKNGGEHHYTLSADERNMLVAAGWSYEGEGWHSAPAGGAGSVPLYREYNPNAFSCNHNYTASGSEHGYLVSIGWRDEGIAWYGVATPDGGADPGSSEGDSSSASTSSGTADSGASTDSIVYWVPGGSVYHSTIDCPALGRSDASSIRSGTVADALDAGKSRACKDCW